MPSPLWRRLAVGLFACALSIQARAATVYTYDANGNRATKVEDDVTWTYVYDAQNRLREIQRDGLVFEAYQYDYQGHRIRKTSSTGVVRYVWDADRIIAETDDFGNVIAKYDYEGERLLAVHHVTEGEAFYLFDALGSPVDLVKADSSVAARYRYDAWGELTGNSGQCSNPFLFTGYQSDPDTRLHYAKARFYDPEIGRFLTPDPVTGEINTPLSLHPFAYAYDKVLVLAIPLRDFASQRRSSGPRTTSPGWSAASRL